MNQLKPFIIDALRRGYSIDQVRLHLQQSHFPIDQINQAMYEVQLDQYHAQNPPVQKVHHLHLASLLILIFLVISFSFGLYIVYDNFILAKPEIQSAVLIPKMDIAPLTMQVYQGEEFTLSITLKGTHIIILDLQDLNHNSLKTESIEIENKKVTSITIPKDLLPGKYFLYATVDDLEESILFTVKEKKVDTCPVCDDRNSCTSDYCSADTDFQCTYKPIIPCCGDGFCALAEQCDVDCKKTATPPPVKPIKVDTETLFRQLEYVKNLSIINRDEALNICEKMSFQASKDQCYLNVVGSIYDPNLCNKIVSPDVFDKCFTLIAQDSGDSTFCEELAESANKDACYFSFVSKNEFYCEKISDPTRKNVCFSLKEYYARSTS